MVLLTEYRTLVQIDCRYVGFMNCFIFKAKGKTFSIKGVEDAVISTIFRKVKMKDEQTAPRSFRGKTYAQMVQAIKNGTDRFNWIWSTDLPKFFELLQNTKSIY